MKNRIKNVLVALVALLAFGTVFFKFVEDWNWVDAFYFTATSINALGYGDIHPLTDVGKIAAAIFTFVSVSLFLYIIGLFAGRDADKK